MKNGFIRSVLVLIAVLLSLYIDAKDIKVLAIGNSFSEDAVEQYLYELALEGGDNLIIGNAYRGGQGLQLHWNVVSNNKAEFEYRKIVNGKKTNSNSKTLLHCLKDEDWDYITFQQVSQDSGLESTYEPWLTNLMGYVENIIQNSEVKYGVHRTWAYAAESNHNGFLNYNRDQLIMFRSIVDAVNNVVKKHNDIDLIIPSGTAIQNARTSFLGDNFCRDGYHLNELGRYVAACTWLEMVTEQSSVAKKFRPNSIDEVVALLAQHSAHEAVRNPDQITSMLSFGYEDENKITPDSIKVNFGNSTTSEQWNNLSMSNKFIYNLKDVNRNETEIFMLMDDDFSGTNTEGEQVTTTKLNMPRDVSSSAIWGYAQGNFGGGKIQPTGGFSFSHLNPNLVYDFYIFGSRKNANDNRETQYVFHGKNRKRAHLDAANNTSKQAVVKGIKPDKNGVIKFAVNPGDNNTNEYKFYYINALMIVGREYQEGDFDDNEVDPKIEIKAEQKYHIKNINSGLYLCRYPDKSTANRGDFCTIGLSPSEDMFEFTFNAVSDDEPIYTISSSSGGYINSGEGGKCVLGTKTDLNNAYIKIEAEDEEIFKIRALWRYEPNYINVTPAYIQANQTAGARWTLEPVESTNTTNPNIISISVFPTLSNGNLYIETDSHAKISITDLSGNFLNSYESVGGRKSINLNYANGLYLVHISTEKGSSVNKVILVNE